MNNSYGLEPRQALKYICEICQNEYSKGKRKININVIWNIADEGLMFEYDTSTHPNPNGYKNAKTCL
jgi:hypothetical protein